MSDTQQNNGDHLTALERAELAEAFAALRLCDAELRTIAAEERALAVAKRSAEAARARAAERFEERRLALYEAHALGERDAINVTTGAIQHAPTTPAPSA